MAEKRRGDFYLVFLGLVLGFALASIFSPRLIVWYSKPPFEIGVDCSRAIDWGITQIIRWQIAGMVVFSLGLWTLSAIVRKKRVSDKSDP